NISLKNVADSSASCAWTMVWLKATAMTPPCRAFVETYSAYMRSVTAYATSGPKAPFERTTVERRDIGPKDVLVSIAFAGICHSDIHTAFGEWGDVIYPLVPGHEIAGVVAEVGPDVTKHAVGDR